MADPPSNSDRRANDHTVPPGMPRWVKVMVIVALVVIVALIVIMALSGGEHGPGLHNPAG